MQTFLPTFLAVLSAFLLIAFLRTHTAREMLSEAGRWWSARWKRVLGWSVGLLVAYGVFFVALALYSPDRYHPAQYALQKSAYLLVVLAVGITVRVVVFGGVFRFFRRHRVQSARPPAKSGRNF